MEENPEAETEEFSGKQKEVEQVANPIMRKVSERCFYLLLICCVFESLYH